MANTFSNMANTSSLLATKKVSDINMKVKTQLILWHKKRSKVIEDYEVDCISTDSDDSDYNPQLQDHRRNTENPDAKSVNETTPEKRTVNKVNIEERMQRKTLVRKRKANERFMSNSDCDSDDVDISNDTLSANYNESSVGQSENVIGNGKFINGSSKKLNITNTNYYSRKINGNICNSPIDRIKNSENINSDNNSVTSSTSQRIIDSDIDNSIEFSPNSSLDSSNFQSKERLSSKFSTISCKDFTPLPDHSEFGDQIEVHMSIKFPVILNDHQILKLLSYCGQIIAWRRLPQLVASAVTSTGVCNIKSVSSALRLIRVLDNFRINGFSISVTPRTESQSTINYFIKRLNYRFTNKDSKTDALVKKGYSEWKYGISNINLLLTQGDSNSDIISVRNITKYLSENNLSYHYGFVNVKRISYSRAEMLHLRLSSASLVLDEPLVISLSIIGIRSSILRNKENNNTFIGNQINCHRIMTEDVQQYSQNIYESQDFNEGSSDPILTNKEQLTASTPVTAAKELFPFSLPSYKIHPCPTNDCNKKEKCPYYHDFDDKRRDPVVYKYRPRMCTLSSSCIRSANCNFSHNEFERFYHPDFFRTKPCISNPCKFGKFCPFEHSSYESEKEIPSSSQREASMITLGREDDNSSDSGFKSPSIRSVEKEAADFPEELNNRKDGIQVKNNSLMNNTNFSLNGNCRISVRGNDSNFLYGEQRKRDNEDDEVPVMTARKRFKPNDIALMANFQSPINAQCTSGANELSSNANDSIFHRPNSNQHPPCGGPEKVPLVIDLDSDDSDTPLVETEVIMNSHSSGPSSNNKTAFVNTEVNKNLYSSVASSYDKKEENTDTTDKTMDCLDSLVKVESQLGVCGNFVRILWIRATIMNKSKENTFKIFENTDNIYLLNIVYHKLLCQITSGDSPEHLNDILQDAIEKVDMVLRLLQIPVKKEFTNRININGLAKAMRGRRREQVVKFIEQTFNYMFKKNPCENEINKVWTDVAPKLYEMTILEKESKSISHMSHIVSHTQNASQLNDNERNLTNEPTEALSALLSILPVSTSTSNEPVEGVNQENSLHFRKSSEVSTVCNNEKMSMTYVPQKSISSISMESSYNQKDQANLKLQSTLDSRISMNAKDKYQSNPHYKSNAMDKMTFAQSLGAQDSFEDSLTPEQREPEPEPERDANHTPLTSLFPGMSSDNSRLQRDSDARPCLINTQPQIDMATQSPHLPPQSISYLKSRNNIEESSSSNTPSNSKPIDQDERSLLLGFADQQGKLALYEMTYQGTIPMDGQGAADITQAGQTMPPQSSSTLMPPKLGDLINASSNIENIANGSKYGKHLNKDNSSQFLSPRKKHSGSSTRSGVQGDLRKVKRIIDGIRSSRGNSILENQVMEQSQQSPQELDLESVPSTSTMTFGDLNDSIASEINAHQLAYLLINFKSYDRETKESICDLVKNTKKRFPAVYEQTYHVKSIMEKEGYLAQKR